MDTDVCNWNDLSRVTFTFVTLITSYIVTLIELFLNGTRQWKWKGGKGTQRGWTKARERVQQLPGCRLVSASLAKLGLAELAQ